MTATQKVKLVASVVGEYSLSSALAAVELPTSTWYYHQQQKVENPASQQNLGDDIEPFGDLRGHGSCS